MKHTLVYALVVCCVGWLSSAVVAQEGGGPPRDGGKQSGPAERRDEKRPPGGPGMREGGPGRRLMELAQGTPPGMRELEVFRGYLELVDRFTRIAHDPTTSGVAAVIQANDLLRPRGADAVIEYFNKLLPQTKNEAVQRAIRLQLAEAYKRSNQSDKALEQLQAIITSVPVGTEMRPVPPPAPER